MELKQGYRRTEIGSIPSDWDVVAIGSVAEFSGGSQPPRSVFKYSESDGYIRLIQIRDYKSDDFLTYVPRHLARKFCAADDIMIGRYGPPIFQILRGIEGAYNVALIKATPNENILKSYLYLVLKQEKLFNLIEAMSRRTSGQTGVEMPALKGYLFPLPSKHEQHAIAKAVSDVDALIAGLEKLIAKKRDLKQAAMQQLLTGQTRLPGFSGEWVKRTLGEIGEISGAGVDKKIRFGEQPVRLLNYMDVYKRTFLKSSDFSHEVSAKPDQIRRCSVKVGDVFFTPTSEVREDIGHSAVALEDMPDVAYSYHVVRLRIFDGWDPTFSAYPFQTKSFLDQASTTCEGSGTRYVITLPKFRALEILYPADKREQAAIASVLFDMDAEIVVLETRLAKTRDLKQGMMQELLTGRTRLV